MLVWLLKRFKKPKPTGLEIPLGTHFTVGQFHKMCVSGLTYEDLLHFADCTSCKAYFDDLWYKFDHFKSKT
ncbi:MAG TPA: hypothetical protein VJH71_03390 [Candidatus Paceibacterota bacterium]